MHGAILNISHAFVSSAALVEVYDVHLMTAGLRTATVCIYVR